MKWILAFTLFFCTLTADVSHLYPWVADYQLAQQLQNRISPPDGYTRRPTSSSSFTQWLRGLPLKAGRPEVHLYDGRRKANQQVHEAILDIDVGKRDLQQCADAVMRLRAEYLWNNKQEDQIHFNYTSGDKASWNKWKAGFRPTIRGNHVSWSQKASANSSYANFKSYLQNVFTYAGTFSLNKELKSVTDMCTIQPGDVFIQGGFPGHAVMVLDVVHHETSGDPLFLLAQSYMPAQEIHILRNLRDPNLSPWYELPKGSLPTPEWTFPKNSLKRFQN